MKSIFAIILSALMAIVPVTGETAVEEANAEVYMIEGQVVQADENGILINTADMGEVLVLTTDETLWEGTEALEAGDYAYVDYNGMMTRSLPPQITATVIRSWRMEGVVSEVYAEENAMLITTGTHGEVYVHLPATAEDAVPADEAQAETDAEAPAGEQQVEAAILPAAGDNVTVYFNGVMTMSLPGQISAGMVVIHPAEAA